MLEWKIIKHSNTRTAPIIKEDNSVRICLDAPELNKKLEMDYEYLHLFVSTELKYINVFNIRFILTNSVGKKQVKLFRFYVSKSSIRVENSCCGLKQLSETLKISYKAFHHMLHVDFDRRNVSVKFFECLPKKVQASRSTYTRFGKDAG